MTKKTKGEKPIGYSLIAHTTSVLLATIDKIASVKR